MKTKKTRGELKEDKKWLIVLSFSFGVLFLLVSTTAIHRDLKIEELQTQLSECQDEIPEVINGNLYIGYEDGVRIGYHQDYLNKNIWYRCARDCEVIE